METLDDRITRDGPVKELDAVGWAIRLAKRLEALHSLGVAHGSVSPACILTGGSARTSRAYIADVQVTTSSLAFQSPERILGGDLSPADDTWAVACTLYTALTGTSPFAGAHDAETKQRILAGAAAPLAVFDVGDDDLQHILDSALTRELGGRISSVAALRSALEEWHPDPGVGALSPLDDDDASEGDEDVRTVMRRAPAFLSEAKPAPASALMPDDDDEDQATRTREFTPNSAGSSPFGAGAPFAPGAAARESAHRPAAGRMYDAPSPGFGAASGYGGAAPRAAIGGAAPRRAPDEDDDEDDHENARTRMRNSPIDDHAHPSGPRVAGGFMLDEDSEDGARTRMRDPAVEPWGTAPLGRSRQAPGGSAPDASGAGQPGQSPGWSRDPVPTKTLALAGFELPADLSPHSGLFPRAQNNGPAASVTSSTSPEASGSRGPSTFPTMGAPHGEPVAASFQAAPRAGPMVPAGQPDPGLAQLDAAAAATNSRRVVVLTAAIALLVIAATTFVVLLLRGIN